MNGVLGRALAVTAVLVIAASSPAAAQNLLHAEVSVGGVATAVGPSGGLYVDGTWAVLPMTSAVGEFQIFRANAFEVLALGGIRQQLYRGPQGQLYAQALLGVAAGYSRRCDLCAPRVTEFGLGTDIRLSKHWAVRARGDIRVGGSAGDLLYPTLGAGITRTWGSR